jgi:hypothetical protein
MKRKTGFKLWVFKFNLYRYSLAVLLGVRASPAALFFPLFIAALMPLRMILAKAGGCAAVESS